MRPRRLLALFLGLGLLTTLFPLVAPAPTLAAERVVVYGEGAAGMLRDFGFKVLDDYGAFATADVPAKAPQLLAQHGRTVAPLDTSTGRGAYRFDARAGLDGVPPAWRSDGGAYSLVAFRGPVTSEWREALAGLGPVYDYLPHHSYIARADREALAQLPGVAFVGPYHAGYKLDPDLLEKGGPLALTVLAWPDADLGTLERDLGALGARVLASALVEGLDGIVHVEADAATLRAIAGLEAVNFVERTAGAPSTDNELATGIVQSGSGTSRAVNARGVDGSTQILSICDTGVDTTVAGGVRRMAHEMFDDPASPAVAYQTPSPAHRKVLLYYSPVESGTTKGDTDDSDGHGTHTAGTAAGDAPGFLVHNNHDAGAYAAKLAVCDITVGGGFQIPLDYATMWDPAYDLGARVNSNSWGSAHSNVYNALARQHDDYAWDHRDFNILRSAGNTGPSGQLRPEAVAKDALAIGGSQNANLNPEALYGSSSRGPAADGRVKPDVVAPAQCLESADAGTASGYTCLTGTSMATPTAASAVALVRDYFAKGFYPGGAAGSGPALDPSRALVSAVLYASGYEMTGPGSHQGVYHPATANALGKAIPPAGLAPLYNGISQLPVTPASTWVNGNTGWGRIHLENALHFAGDARGLLAVDEAAGLATGDLRAVDFTVAEGGEPLRVMLVWTDFPGAVNANPALVNNLDLVVTGPDGTVYLGNNFLGRDSLAGGVPDSINIAEAVALSAPAAGAYTATVVGLNVAAGTQPFALVVVGALA